MLLMSHALLTLLGLVAVCSRGDVEGGRGMQGGAVAALRDVPACGDVLDALRPSSIGVLEGSSRSDPPAGLQGGGLRAVFLAASTRLVVVVEMSGRVFVEEAALIAGVQET